MPEAARADVLLVSSPRPPWISPRAFEMSENSCPPLGLLYLASALEAAGITASVHDLYRTGARPGEVVRLLEETRATVVGISSLTSDTRWPWTFADW